jgi:hypothetical protein
MLAWLIAFAFTQAVEMPIYVRGARATWAEAFGASALTHPMVWFVIPGWVDAAYLAWLAPHPSLQLAASGRWWLMLVVAETFAVLAEAGYLAYLRRPRPLVWSLVANASSATLGLLCRRIFGYP